MRHAVVAPIFIVGCPRSGTSILYKKMATHPDLAWFLKSSRKFPRSILLSRLAALRTRSTRPREAGAIWRRFAKGLRDDDSLRREDVTPAARRYFHDVLATQMRLFDKPRFLAKHPRNGLRMDHFQEIFPDAVFLHIVRNGFAAAHSIYQCRVRAGDEHRYWDIKPPGWRELLDLPPVTACALQWQKTMAFIRESGQRLPVGQYCEVRYEDFTAAPQDALLRIGAACHLEWEPAHLARIVADVGSRDHKWRESFSPDQIAELDAVIGADGMADTKGANPAGLSFDVGRVSSSTPH